jgi:hypothetical protein
MRRSLITFALLFTAASLSAQEFDVFDLNDFVDPRLHGAVYDHHGKLTDRGDVFRLVRIATGGISDYAWRSTPTHDNVGFLHVVASEYRGNLQANLKATFLEGQHDNALPRYRLMTQVAHYTLHQASSEVKKGGVRRIAGRALLSMAIEENRLDVITGAPVRRFNTEIAAEVDVAMSLPGGRNASGSLVWTSRQTATPGEQICVANCTNALPLEFLDPSQPPSPKYVFTPGQTHRIQRASYYYRLEEHTLANRYRFGVSFGVGGEKTDRWRWGATRVGVRGAMDVGHLGTFNVTWTPTFVPRSVGRRTTQEVAIFLDQTVWAFLGR